MLLKGQARNERTILGTCAEKREIKRKEDEKLQGLSKNVKNTELLGRGIGQSKP